MSVPAIGRGVLALLLAAATACGGLPRAAAGIPGRPAAVPRNGLEVIGAMRFAHPSRELRSLAFGVTVTEYHSDTTTRRERAHAVLPGRLRVTTIPEARRTGVVRDGLRMAEFEEGRRVASRRYVDLVTLLAYDVFAQSIDTTIMWLDSLGMRFGFARLAEWEGRRVWVVGAEVGDTTSDQFWVDAERWRVVRVIQRPPGAARPDDVRFESFATVRDVPVPRRILVYRGGRLAQRREMANFIANTRIPDRAFDLARWRSIED